MEQNNCKVTEETKKQSIELETISQALGTVWCKNYSIPNVSIKAGGVRQQIGTVVITEKAIFILEEKYMEKDVYIDEQGNIFRDGEYINICKEMEHKERLLREMLEFDIGVKEGEVPLNIVCVVVFNNAGIKIKNENKHVRVCTLDKLQETIDYYEDDYIYSSYDMLCILKTVDSIKLSGKISESVCSRLKLLDFFKKEDAMKRRGQIYGVYEEENYKLLCEIKKEINEIKLNLATVVERYNGI